MQKITAILLLIVLVLGLGTPTFATGETVQHTYSKYANSGIRHEVCTTLAGTSALSYYTDSYSYSTLTGLSGDALLQSLRSLMTDTHSYETVYDECRDYADETDCENGDGTTINLTYSSFVSNYGEYINNTKKGWNREHVWPKSLGGFSTTGAGADLHHIRPTDSSINGQRGNKKYGEVENGKQIVGTVVTDGTLGGYSGNGLFEPLDNAKGDVARICLYVYVRYGGELSKCASITNVFQSVDVLLSWMELDPVDTWEMGRNEVVQGIQGNRNVFIDFPELAWLLFDREVPADLQTPSGGEVDPCTEGHRYGLWTVEKAASENEPGQRIHTCRTCGEAETQEIPAWSDCDHAFGSWMTSGDETARYCSICSFRELESKGLPVWAWIVIAVAIAAAAAVAVVVIVKRKK